MKPSQNTTVIMSVTKIQNVDNVYRNCGPQIAENVEVSKMENEDNLKLLRLMREAFEDNLKLLRLMREAFEDGGDVKREDENLHGSRGDERLMREAFEYGGDVKREDVNLHGSRGGVQYIRVQCSTLQYSIVQYSNSIVQVSAVQYREAFVDGDDGKREDDNLHGRREGVQYIVVQYSTVQYSTVQVSAVQYRDYKNDGQRTRRNEGINHETQIRVENMKLWEGLKVEKVWEGFNPEKLRHIIPEEASQNLDSRKKESEHGRSDGEQSDGNKPYTTTGWTGYGTEHGTEHGTDTGGTEHGTGYGTEHGTGTGGTEYGTEHGKEHGTWDRT